MEGRRQIREAIRARLPPEAFAPRPGRAWLAVPLLLGIVALTGTMVFGRLPLIADIALGLSAGVLYASLFFLGHEVAHGAVLRSRKLQNLILYPAFAIFLLSPTLWRIYHVGVHHTLTNVPGRDPDTYGTLAAYKSMDHGNGVLLLAPGSGHWISALHLLTWFTVQSQSVLWRTAPSSPDFAELDRRRAILESGTMYLMWMALMPWFGPLNAVLAILLPMAVANFCVMTYVVTNHLLRPLGDGRNPLDNTMSVRSHPLLDQLFFHFSHHVEHHLFPNISTCQAPRVRAVLQEIAGDRYLAPPHWRALWQVYQTPRLYDDDGNLVNVFTGRRIALADVETRLRAATVTPSIEAPDQSS